MKKILVLDDSADRVEWLEDVLYENNKDVKVFWAQNLNDFLFYLRQEPDMITFDHDLGLEYTGMEVAEFCGYRIPDVPILVWSVNPTGSRNIFKYFKDTCGFSHLKRYEFGLMADAIKDFVLEVVGK